MADFLSKWVPSSGAPFSFSGLYELDRDSVTDSGIQRRIPSADSNGDGEWSSDSLAETRTVTIQGTLNTASADALRTAIGTLAAQFSTRAEGNLYIHSDRFLQCRLAKFDYDPENGWGNRTWRATFKASTAPFWQDDTEWSDDAGGGEISYPPLGDLLTPTRIEVVVDGFSSAGRIGFVHAGGSALLRPAALGTYIIDGENGTVTYAGNDAITQFYQNFPVLDPAGGTITITTLSGASYSSAIAYARGRHESL